MSPVDSNTLAHKALCEAFARTLYSIEQQPQIFTDPDEAQRLASKLHAMIERIVQHLGAAPLFYALGQPLSIHNPPCSIILPSLSLSKSLDAPSNEGTLPSNNMGSPSAPVYPLAQACYWFCSENPLHSPNFLLYLISLGAPIFTPSALYRSPHKMFVPGSEIFDLNAISPFELSLTHSNYYLIKKALTEIEQLTPQQVCAFEMYCTLPDPMYLELSSRLKSKAEEHILDSTLLPPEEQPTKGKRGKRL